MEKSCPPHSKRPINSHHISEGSWFLEGSLGIEPLTVFVADTLVQIDFGINFGTAKVAKASFEDVPVLEVDILGCDVERHVVQVG